MAGAERVVVGKKDYTCADFSDDQFVKKGSMMFTHETAPRVEVDITTPDTPEAKLWDGWGTGLKPAVEMIMVAMKPNEGTYANNALKWGVIIYLSKFHLSIAKLHVQGSRLTNGKQGHCLIKSLLENEGEIVEGAGEEQVWGRQCKGKAIYMDTIIDKICFKLEQLEGQYKFWAPEWIKSFKEEK